MRLRLLPHSHLHYLLQHLCSGCRYELLRLLCRQKTSDGKMRQVVSKDELDRVIDKVSIIVCTYMYLGVSS